MDTDPDSDLLASGARDGDRAAFERLVAAEYDFMFRVAFKWCRNRADAEDIAQDACIRLARGISGWSGKAAFRSWLYRLVINAAIDWRRRNDRPVEDYGEERAGGGDAETQLYAREMFAVIDRLPPKEKGALLLVHAEGLSHAEAARVLEVKESTVSWYIHEARKKLGVREGERHHG